MTIRKAVGRPPKVNMMTINKLADALQHSATVSDACRYAQISRDTYYRYYRSEPMFTDRMDTAKSSQYKIVFSSLTSF